MIDLKAVFEELLKLADNIGWLAIFVLLIGLVVNAGATLVFVIVALMVGPAELGFDHERILELFCAGALSFVLAFLLGMQLEKTE